MSPLITKILLIRSCYKAEDIFLFLNVLWKKCSVSIKSIPIK